LPFITVRNDITSILRHTCTTIRNHEGYISDTLVFKEQNGEIDCAVLRQASNDSEILLNYGRELRVPMHFIHWHENEDQLLPIDGVKRLSVVQRLLLDQWLELIHATKKLSRIRSNHPQCALLNPELRQHLADAGFASFAKPPREGRAAELMISLHCAGNQKTFDKGRNRWLVPLKNLVNHHPYGAPQQPIPGRVAVSTSAISGPNGTFENYGDYDAMQLLLFFGFLCPQIRVVHSVPLTFSLQHWGQVTIGRGGERYRDGQSMPVARIARTEEGLSIQQLSARPGNRASLLSLLAMLGHVQYDMALSRAKSHAEQLLDTIMKANFAYYDRLINLVDNARNQTVISSLLLLENLDLMARLQQQQIIAFWG
jgi:hypothetical protein